MVTLRSDHSWPLAGLGYFLGHPRLWLAPLAATALGWAAVLVVASLVLWWQWPGAEIEGVWSNLWRGILALGWAGVAAVVTWLALLPLLVGLAYEALVKRVLCDHEVPLGEERTLSAIKSAMIVLVRNLGWMLLWPVLAVLCNLGAFALPVAAPILAPLGVFLSQYGVAHIAVLEGGDVALGSRGLPGTRRWRLLRERRRDVLAAAAIGALLSLVLGFTFVGWLLFMPAMFTGAALWVARWDLTGEPDVAMAVGGPAADGEPCPLPPVTEVGS